MSLGRIVLAPPERRELKRRARKRSLAVELVKRTEVILMLAPRVILTGKFGSNWIAVTSISGSGRGAFKKSVWPDWIRAIAVVNAERGQPRPRRVSWRPRVKVPRMLRPIGAAIGWPKSWALVSRAGAVSGAISVFSRIDCVGTWPAMTRSLER